MPHLEEHECVSKTDVNGSSCEKEEGVKEEGIERAQSQLLARGVKFRNHTEVPHVWAVSVS